MTDKTKAFVTLGADIGGKDAYNVLNEHILTLRKLLAEMCNGPYGSSIKEIALALRVDGCVQAWEKCGVEGVALQGKKAYAIADVYVPRHIWSDGDSNKIREFLGAGIKSAITQIADHARSLRVDISDKDLERDVARAVLAFTSST